MATTKVNTTAIKNDIITEPFPYQFGADIYDQHGAHSIQTAVDYYAKMDDQGLIEDAFPDGSMTSIAGFMAMCNELSSSVIFARDITTGEVAGHCYLTEQRGLACQVHFAVLKGFHGPIAITMAKDIARQVFKHSSLKTLVGLTPVTNRLALRFIDRVGYKVIGIIPYTYYIAKIDEYVDGVLSTLTPENL